MALGAGDLLRGGLMDQALHIFVTINAGKHRAVDGVLQLLRIHEQTHLRPIDIRGHGGVRVAGKAIFVLELMLGASAAGAEKKG
jgi:hypothetical protein